MTDFHPGLTCLTFRRTSARARGGDDRRGREGSSRAAFDEGSRPEYTSTTMQPLKAHVKDGRIVLDEPTDLPEGEVVYLHLVDRVVADDRNDLDDADRAALHRELDASTAEADAGETEDFAQVLAELRQRQ
jgi:hypothetical protein